MRIERAFNHRGDFDSAVRKVERQLRRAGHVVHIRYDLGYDSTGDPAVHFRIVLPDGSVKRERFLEAMQTVSSEIDRKVRPQSEWGVYPYFRYWSKSTQEASHDPAWA